jgi:hypothetical protein
MQLSKYFVLFVENYLISKALMTEEVSKNLRDHSLLLVLFFIAKQG